MGRAIDENGAHFKGKLGVAVRRSIKDLLHEHGRDRDRFIADLAPELRWFLTEHYIATQWYLLPGAERLLAEVAREIDMDPLELARRVGHDVAYASAGRVGRTIISIFGTPTRVARHLDTMMKQLYDSGQVKGEYTPDQGLLRVRRSGWTPHHSLLCNTLLGSLECIAEHMSGFHLREAKRTACVSQGDGECVFELRFETR